MWAWADVCAELCTCVGMCAGQPSLSIRSHKVDNSCMACIVCVAHNMHNCITLQMITPLDSFHLEVCIQPYLRKDKIRKNIVGKAHCSITA